MNLLKARLVDDWATKAESNLRAAITINSDFAPAHNALAYVLAFAMPKQNPEEAYLEVGRAIQLEPGNVHYRVQAVHILERLGRADDAIKTANIAVGGAKTPQERTEASAALTSAQQYQAYKNREQEFRKAQASSQPASPNLEPTPEATPWQPMASSTTSSSKSSTGRNANP